MISEMKRRKKNNNNNCNKNDEFQPDRSIALLDDSMNVMGKRLSLRPTRVRTVYTYVPMTRRRTFARRDHIIFLIHCGDTCERDGEIFVNFRDTTNGFRLTTDCRRYSVTAAADVYNSSS